jgi:predicted adenine nucleotide alpha hydrolase (AANH) superfamily ATPase
MIQSRTGRHRLHKPRLLLHVCCAACATSVVQALREDFDLTGFFCNPNIHPEGEYQLRRLQLERYATQVAMPFVVADYDVERWFSLVRQHERDPEGAQRCVLCYRMRLEDTARFAADHGYEYFTTTLSVSPHKRAEVINRLGHQLAEAYAVSFHAADFKKKDGFKISCELSQRFGLYRQTYCGCLFSRCPGSM